MLKQAASILTQNDLGGYTVPTHGLYPFQWNWDSALSAPGLFHLDEARGWTELDTLLAHQWPCGMVPHIVFHKEDAGYFPGPEIWGTNRPVPTSGITQPAVAGFAARRMFCRARDRDMARARARALLQPIARWHEWFFTTRDPRGTGLVALIHPWESGRDNSIDWDIPFARVPTDGVPAFKRRDTLHADPDHRPTHAQYQRYIWLVQHFRAQGWDTGVLHDASPFQVVDPGFNAILLRACCDLADLADDLGEPGIARDQRALAARGLAAMETLWSEPHQQYLCQDRAGGGALIDSASVGGLLPVFAPIAQIRADAIATRIESLGAKTRYLVPSHDPDTPGYDPARYWRGPVWLIVNHMIADGLARDGHGATAARLVNDSLTLIGTGGFSEYYHPGSGAPCGGPQFTWTAAMVIEFLTQSQNQDNSQDRSPARAGP